MAKQAPNPIDIQDFQFKLHTRLKVFPNDHNSFKKFHNILASTSRFGLVFVGSSSPSFKVIQISHIEALTQKENDESNYKCRTIHLPSRPTHLSVNCDGTKLAVVTEKNACTSAIIYDVSSFLKKDVIIVQEIRLSASPGVETVESTWNPTLPNVFTACKSDGTLGVYEFKETGIDIHELPIESQATCMCWSPKGKQIAVGSNNGKITQYKPDLKAMKVINEPPLDGSYSVVAIQWISSFQFIAIYKSSNPQFGSTLLVVDAPKAGEVTYINYEDICYSNGNARPIQFYTIHEPLWNILIVASSNSMEVGVLGIEKEEWTQWILADTARAELPLSSSKQDTLPIGLTLNKSAVEPIVFGEHSLPPAPFLFVLSDHGVLCCFRMINIKSGVSSICQPPEALTDISGLSSFVSSGSLKPPPPPPVQVITPTAQLITKPNPLPAQIPQSPLTPPKEIPRPSKELPLNQTPTFASSASSSFFTTTSDPTISTVKSNNLTKIIHVKPESSHTISISPKNSHPNQSMSSTTVGSPCPSETRIDQEEADILISKLIREECEVIEKELKILLHKGSSIKIDLGTDGEAVNLIQDADAIQNFLKEVIETNSVQEAEVHSLKQGLIKTWAWYEDARSRYMQSEDPTLNALFRIQQLDPVSQRYMNDIQHLSYYLESQLNQAGRVLDEQWENFQDYCKKISRLKIPTVETIYQTMVRQSAIHQKQKYVLKDISSRIKAQRSKVNGRSLFVSLNNLEQLEKDLLQLQLDPNNILCAQFERVLENQSKLTPSKIKKLEKMLSEKEITHISVNKPQLSNTSLKTLLNNSSTKLRRSDDTVLGAALSPISVGKKTTTAPRIIDFVQSTPNTAVTIPAKNEKLVSDFEKPRSITSDSTPTFNVSVPKTPEDKPGFDFTASAKKTFTFGPQQNANPPASDNQNKFTLSQINNIFNAKTETPISFATLTAPSTTTTSTITQKSQFSFGPVTTSSFTSLFASTKTHTSTKFTPPISNTIGTEGTKSISGTESSAFVPTTQLAFTFTAKSTPTITPSPTTLTTKPSTTAFNFGAASTETPQTPTITKSEPFFAVGKSIPSPKTSLSSLLSESSSTTPSMFKSTIPSNAVTTTVPSSKSVAVDLTTSTSSTQSQFENLFRSFSFSNADTQSNIFNSKIPTTQAQNATQTLPATSIFAPVSKTTSPSFFGSASKPEFSFSANTSTTSKSLFSPVVTCESNTQSTVAEADSTSTAKLGSIFGAPISTSATSMLTNVISGVTVSSNNTTTSSNTAPSTASITTTTSSPLGAKSVFGTATSNIFGNKPSTTAAPTNTIVFGNVTTPSSTPVIFGSTTITTTTPGSNIFGGGTNSVTTSAPPMFSSTTVNTVSDTTPAPTSTIFSGTTTSSIFGGVTATTTSLFGETTSTAPVQVQSPNTTAATTTTPSTPLFGAPSSIDSIFGSLPTATTTSVFASSPVFGTTTNSVFGQPTTSASTLFTTTKSNVFGETTKTATAPFATPANAFENTSTVFGATTGFGTPVSTSSSVFGSTNTATPAFGSSGSLFGNASTTNTGFSQTSTSSFSFATAAANLPNTGFGKPAFGFGSSQGGDGGSFNFNTPTMGGSTTTPNASFGQSTSANPFAKSTSQEQKPVFGGGSLFGTPSSTTASIFGGGSSSVFGGSSTQQTAPAFGSSPSFGSNTAFGQAPAFGQSAFGTSFSSPQQSAPFSGGGGQSVAQSGFGAFGQAQQKTPGFGGAPVFGGSPSGFGSPPSFGSGAPAFGAASTFGSPNKLFGDSSNSTDAFTSPTQQSSTFANLANQNTIGFGALAQQSPTLPTAAPFQRYSFSIKSGRTK
ncbi:hypothetical protein FQR65_LT13383 [Abscondita terminalis]|nr:hypothetical protein FQR65_LT13383 [Abscondita terminalis]